MIYWRWEVEDVIGLIILIKWVGESIESCEVCPK